MTTTRPPVEELLRLASEAAPSPWVSQPSEHYPPRGVVYGADGDSMFSIEWNPGNDYDQLATADYLAAVSPSVVRALCQRVLDLEAASATAAQTEGPGLREALAQIAGEGCAVANVFGNVFGMPMPSWNACLETGFLGADGKPADPPIQCANCKARAALAAAPQAAEGPALDVVYAERNALVVAFATLADQQGWYVWRGTDPDAPDFTVVYVESPAGQMSWHIPDAEWPELASLPDEGPGWDKHTTPEKYARLRALVTDAAYSERPTEENRDRDG